MNRSMLLLVAGCAGLFVCPCHGAASGSDEDLLHIHLPREVVVRESLLHLGEVAVVRGAGPLAAMAANIGVGRLSVPGQKIVLDRPTMLSRLASYGVSSDRVRLTGADAVVVRRRQQTIVGDEFVEMARMFLQQKPPAASIHESIAVTRPKDLVLPGEQANLQLIPQFVQNGARGFVTVRITVVADGREVGSRDIPLRLRYRCRRAVALQEIAEGTALTPEMVKIEETVSDRPEAAGWKPPYGLLASRLVPAGAEIRTDMVVARQPSVVIRRNETVVIRIQRPGLLVTAVGMALQEGRTGDYVKVRNADSHRVIVCKVGADGTVEPVL